MKKLLLIVLSASFLLSACAMFKESLQDSRPYSLCSGFLSSQTCVPYSSKVTCNAALQACQHAQGQVKPWQCGQCVPVTPEHQPDNGGVVNTSSRVHQKRSL